MDNAYFDFAAPGNEPVMSFAPGSPERAALKKQLAAFKSQEMDIPMYIGGKEVRTGKTVDIRPPHEIKHKLGHFHQGTASHVTDAINAALKARQQWAETPWEHRAGIFLKAAELLATKYRAHTNAATMLGQSKNAFQAEIDSACELIDFLRFNVHYLTKIYPAAAGELSRRAQPPGIPSPRRIRTGRNAVQLLRHRRQPAHLRRHVRERGWYGNRPTHRYITPAFS